MTRALPSWCPAGASRWSPACVAIVAGPTRRTSAAERLRRAPRLRVIANVEGNFLPNVDYDECERRGIAMLSIGPVFAQPVAEMALGLALAACREIAESDAAIRRGDERYGPVSAS